MNFGQRLSAERKAKGLTQEQLGEQLKVSLGTVSRWEKEQSPMPSDKLMLCDMLGLDVGYILTGKIRSVTDFEKSENNKNNKLENKIRDSYGFSTIEVADGVFINTDDYAWVPLYDVQVSAGDGRLLDSENILTWISFTKYSLRKQGLNPADLGAVIVHGDSMADTLKPDDCIVVNFTKRVPDGGIFILRVGDMLHVKRLIAEKDTVRVISDNSRYSAWSLGKDDDFEIIGKYEWLGRYG